MWNLITIDTVKQTAAMTRTGGSPQYMTHDKFHHTFTLPLWNKFAPLTIYNHNHHHHHHHKEFPEFKKQNDKIQCKNYLNGNQDDYHRIMGHQKIDECLYLGGSRPPSQLQIIGNENEKIDKNDKQPQKMEKKKKRRRRKKRNNKNKTQQSSNDNCNGNCNKSVTIESKLQRCDSLNLIKNRQRQRQISTDSDDSFIVFYDNNNCSNDNGEVKKSSNFNNYHDDDDNCNYNNDNTKSLASDKKVRFADNNEIHPMVKWSYAYQAARKGPWEQYARDRDRFKKRIRNLEKLLSPVLNNKHRTRIYQERFI